MSLLAFLVMVKKKVSKWVELAIWNKNSQSRHGLVCIFCSHVHTELLFFHALIQEKECASKVKTRYTFNKKNGFITAASHELYNW
jgi:hypothetical protein